MLLCLVIKQWKKFFVIIIIKIGAIYGCLGTLIMDRRILNNEKSQSVVETLVVIIYYRKLCIITLNL